MNYKLRTMNYSPLASRQLLLKLRQNLIADAQNRINKRREDTC